MTGGECEECQQKSQSLQRKNQDVETSNKADSIPPIVQDVLNSPGKPLDQATRGFMEPRFGQDFSRVRVHTDPLASESARAVNAQAYTVGEDLVFAPGQYAPETESGNALLAHELTHVVQQSAHGAGSMQNAKAISDPTDAAEEEANSAVNQVLSGDAVQVHQSPNAALHALSDLETGGIVAGSVAGAVGIGLGIAWLAGGFDKDTFTDKELQAYLTALATKRRIEDHRDSDNKARDIVRRWENGSSEYNIDNGFRTADVAISAFDLKYLLIEEMLSGATLDDDEQAILSILGKMAQPERNKMADRIGYERLYRAFDGEELDLLYGLLPQLASFHPRGGKESKTHTFFEYIEKWEKEHGTVMTFGQKRTLAKGCIGITALNLFSLGNPDLSECYDTFAQVWEAKQKMNEFLASRFPDRRALIFSKRFWSSGMEFEPDPKTGKVDMSGYRYQRRPGFTNFDYGLYDEKTGKWWHANHCDAPFLADPDCKGPMEVYESNLQYYSQPLADFDRQVFCVAVTQQP